MTEDPRADLEATLGRLMKLVATAGTKKRRLAMARADNNVKFDIAKDARDAEKNAHNALDNTIAAYERAYAAGVITLEAPPSNT
jgi:hypothetical protein